MTTAIAQNLDAISDSLPEGFRSEQLDEMLIVQGAPSFQHQHAIAYMMSSLMSAYQHGKHNKNSWIFSFNTKLELPAQTGFFQPDIMGWKISEGIGASDVATIANTCIPHWVCEVQSTNYQYDWNIKKPMYEAMDIEYLWMVNPTEKSLHAFHNQYEKYELIAREKTAQIAPFLNWHINYNRLFGVDL